MPSVVPTFARVLRRALRAAGRSPLDAALSALAVALVAIAIFGPLFAARYPPMVDLPFHAAETSTFRHYLDPAYHFRDQFELQPIRVPYLSMYVTGAILMLVFPAITAVKIAAAIQLALLPAGLAVLRIGMKKSPLPAVLAILPAWGPLAHWGFLNFLGALGLFALVLGLALMLVDSPTNARRIQLSLALIALFFTHVFRFPIAICAVVFAAIVLYPVTRRFTVVIPPLVPPLALFCLWLVVRPASLSAGIGIGFHPDRLAELPDWLTGAFNDPAEPRAIRAAILAIGIIAAVSLLARLFSRPRATPREHAFRARAMVIVLAVAAGSLLLFLVLPMMIGAWWYVYPREATAAAFLALAALPDLPRSAILRAPVAALCLLAPIPITRVVARNYAAFNAATEDYEVITRRLPQAPKLLYLIFDHSGSTRTTSPFTHLPAYVQAERGGWLSYHFTIYGASPIAYRGDRESRDAIPPMTPPLWEARPDLFDVRDRGRFFDWFLVRRQGSPAAIFDADRAIEEVAHEGSWWLYHRGGAPRISSSQTAR